jgi:hypothetical protein
MNMRGAANLLLLLLGLLQRVFRRRLSAYRWCVVHCEYCGIAGARCVVLCARMSSEGSGVELAMNHPTIPAPSSLSSLLWLTHATYVLSREPVDESYW